MNTRLLALAAVLLLAVTGCTKPNDCPPAQSGSGQLDQNPSAQPGSGQPNQNQNPKYGFGLPKGAKSQNQAVWSEAYVLLQEGNCRDTRALMSPDQDQWRNFYDPREVLLYQAAIELCNQNEPFLTRGKELYNRVDTLFPTMKWRDIGWHSGEDLNWHVCEVYRSVTSVVKQVAKDTVSCGWGNPNETCAKVVCQDGQNRFNLDIDPRDAKAPVPMESANG